MLFNGMNAIFAVYRRGGPWLPVPHKANRRRTFTEEDLVQIATMQEDPGVRDSLVRLHPAMIQRIAEDKAKAEKEVCSVPAGVE